jgi:hypothetical protein
MFTDATPAALLLHTPPPVALLSVVVLLTHTCVLPLMKSGNAFTVTTFVR